MNRALVNENQMETSELECFTLEELAPIAKGKIPRHIAIIPDGNRRWAKSQGAKIENGHHNGCNNLILTVRAAKDIGVKAITFYMFSTENWSRDPHEVQALMWLLESFLEEHTPEMIEKGVRFNTIGDLTSLPDSALKAIQATKEATAHCNKIDMIAALNYGARDELRRAFNKILDEIEEGKITRKEITEQMIASHLDTSPWPDPDLFIRTSGEQRVSNFLLWQLSYTEIYIADILWPDFRPNNLLEAVLHFQKRERRFGVDG